MAPDFLKIPGFLRKQFICSRDGKVAGGVYMWETQEAAERFYSGEWLAGIRARYGTEPRMTYFETVALTDKASGQAGGLGIFAAGHTLSPGRSGWLAAERQVGRERT